MKILILRPFPNKVNLQSYNLQEVGLAKALIRKGHQCDVAYFGGNEKDHEERILFAEGAVRVIWLRGFGILKEGFYPTLRKYINNYDIIQVGEYVGITSCWLNRFHQDKVVNYHGPYYCKENRKDILKAAIWDKTLLPLSRKNKMLVLTKSTLATEYLRGKKIQHVTTVGVGLDLENICKPSQEDDRHEFVEYLWENKGNCKYLLYIGAMEERRNILFLLDIFANVLVANPECRLVLIGKGQEEYLAACKQKAEQLGIQDKIFYRERVAQKYLKSVYELSDVFLLPTRYEIFGMVLLEAMYFGLPVITTRNGGSCTLMNPENGIVIDGFDAVCWAQKIGGLLSNDECRRKIGENAHRTIAEEYTWDSLADRFLQIYCKRKEHDCCG